MTRSGQIAVSALAAVLLLGAATLLAAPAHAEFIVDIFQNGANVEATGSGTIDLASLTALGDAVLTGDGVEANPGSIGIGAPASVAEYGGVSGPASFGPGGMTFASSASGGAVSLRAGDLYVPVSYVSGHTLSDRMMFSKTTIAGLGLTLGTYVYSWGSGATADSFVIDVEGATEVPEPATAAVLAIGLAGLAAFGRRRAGATV